LALKGLWSHLKEKLDGFNFMTIGQVIQKLRLMKTELTVTRCARINLIDNSSDLDEKAYVCTSEFVWPSKIKTYTCDDLKPIRKNWDEEIKCRFDVSKCDIVFHVLLKDKLI
jgi:hypothetical protein